MLWGPPVWWTVLMNKWPLTSQPLLTWVGWWAPKAEVSCSDNTWKAVEWHSVLDSPIIYTKLWTLVFFLNNLSCKTHWLISDNVCSLFADYKKNRWFSQTLTNVGFSGCRVLLLLHYLLHWETVWCRTSTDLWSELYKYSTLNERNVARAVVEVRALCRPSSSSFFMDLALCTGDTVLESGTNDKKTKTESTQKYVDSEYLSRKQK